MESKMTCNKIAYNMSLNKQESSSQVKQKMSDELIQRSDYHTNIRKQRHLKTEQSQQIKTPDVDAETKNKDVENQTKKLKSKDNITYTTENTERNKRKDSTGKNEINNRVQNVGEITGDKVPPEMTNVQTKAEQQEQDVVTIKASNNQQKKRDNR